MNLLLAVDIGNTEITCGAFSDEHLAGRFRIATDPKRTSDEYHIAIESLLSTNKISPSEVSSVVMCSVVPPLNATFAHLFAELMPRPLLVVESGVRTGVRIRMENPREVGPDRIANAVGVHRLYPGPAIVVDLGTATTMDVVSAEGEYLGGVIAPGIALAGASLYNGTAMLPWVEMRHPEKVIGTNTATAMRSGIVLGYTSLVEGLVERIKREFNPQAQVIATGGYSGLISQETDIFTFVDNDITLKGLYFIFQLNQEPRS